MDFIRVETASGSTYDIDDKARRIRRLGNKDGVPPTARQGDDLIWKLFCYLIVMPAGLLINWEGTEKCTLTNKITSTLTEDERLRLFTLGPITFVATEIQEIKVKEQS